MPKTDIVYPQTAGQIIASRPDFIPAEDLGMGNEVLSRYVTPPALKIVQKQSRDELLSLFAPGTGIVVPTQAVLVENDVPFHFTPLFMYAEFITWTPISARARGVPAVLERSLDPKSTLAIKATNQDTWNETIVYEGKELEVRHVEHLCFVVKLVGHPLGDAIPWMTISFAKAEHKLGRALSGLIKMRNAPPFSCVFEARVAKAPRSNEYGSWFGLDVNNPTDRSPWVGAEEYAANKEVHLELSRIHADGLLQVAHEEVEPNTKNETAADEM